MAALIAGRFDPDAKLSEGTFAEVWRAADTHAASPDRFVVLKIFRPSARGNPACPWQPVFREVEAGARMAPHPNVLSPWALVYARVFDAETPCLVLDYVDGPNLALWLRGLPPPGPVSLPSRCTLMTGVLRGLAHAHASGVVHNDVSFGNVLVRTRETPEAVLVDFGCARTDDAGDPDAVEDPSALQPINPPPYTHALPRPFAARRDVYAFATLTYLALSGRHPLSDDWQSLRTGGWAGAALPHATLPRRALLALAPWTNDHPRFRDLSALLLRCVAADPAARPASATDVLAEWEHIMR